jgi:UDP-N-acetyl-D-glucosamine dehydrogenase
VAFKPNVSDARNSPASDVISGLAARGAAVVFHDPHVSKFRDSAGATYTGIELEPLLDESDVVVILVGHRAVDWDRVFDRARLIVDTVNSSAGRKTRDQQVRRLGAGWSTERAEVVAAVQAAGVPAAAVPAKA